MTDMKTSPLFNDEFTGEPPTKRVLAYLQEQREKGKNIVGIYCGYAPLELIRAMDLAIAGLCAFSNTPIEAAESVLPVNLCPLIKSSYGFIMTDTCPFFAVSDAVVAETTCDGKKKMFELISDSKPMFVMDLPQLPDDEDSVDNWAKMINKLRKFLGSVFHTSVTDSEIEEQLKDTNCKNRLMNKIFDFAALQPPVISWAEIYDITFLAQVASAKEIGNKLEEIIVKLEKRVKDGYFYGPQNAPRVLVTGCPVGGDATKVFKIIEESGGVIVALDACSGMKAYMDNIEENTGNPVKAMAERYLHIPCSCMTPNTRRLTALDTLIDKFKPDVVIDVVLQACHSYNIESHKVEEHIKKKHGIPFQKIVTDYSQNDVGQIRTRIEAILETC